MTHNVDLSEARERLAEFADEAARGEDIVITRGDGASFKLVPLSIGAPRPTFGSARGQIEMAEDFDQPLDDFAEYTS